MDIGIVSKRYAKALYEYACGNKKEEAVYKEMLVLSATFIQVKKLRQALENPILPIDEKEKLLCEAAGGKVSEEYKRFMTLVLNERREKFIQFMAGSYISLYRKMNHISIGKLITASPVDAKVINRMKKMVAKGIEGIVEFDTSVDPSLLGGFIFELNFERCDASVATQLAKVRQQFIDKNKRIV